MGAPAGSDSVIASAITRLERLSDRELAPDKINKNEPNDNSAAIAKVESCAFFLILNTTKDNISNIPLPINQGV